MTGAGAGGSSGRRFSSRRTALFLYVVLVGLPAVVFGALLFRQLTQDQRRLLAEVPRECRDAADRLAKSAASRVERLLVTESSRPFWEYRPTFYPDGLGTMIRPERSSLSSRRPQPGIVGWFSFHASGAAAGIAPKITVLRGPTRPGPDPIASSIEDLVYAEVAAPLWGGRLRPEDELERAREDGYGRTERELIRTVVLNLSTGSTAECRQALEDNPQFQSRDTEDGRDRHTVNLQYLSLRVIERGEGEPPAVIALRHVSIPRISDLPFLPACFDAVRDPVHLVQGFVVDPDWLFNTMPREVASRVLSTSQKLVLPGAFVEPKEDLPLEDVRFFEAIAGFLDQESAMPDSLLRVSTDATSLRRDFRVQNAWFGGMAFILTISMAIGIRLLLSSIRQSRVETERTRNFVASVTHELRTPIAAVKLYGEMLHDGWVQDEQKRQEYLARIVTESDRLDGLVDRVLLRRKLFDRSHSPVPGDLNEEILAQRPDLEVVAGRDTEDLNFDLSPGLPHVLLLPDGIHVIIQNLVENARKYAPVPMGPDGPEGEPILIRTRLSQKGNVLLEVADRGPGIPEKDRGRVFEAFLRLGEESTRTTKGTGLGLHLVSLQAGAMGGKVRVLPREGGGTVFQVQLKRA